MKVRNLFFIGLIYFFSFFLKNCQTQINSTKISILTTVQATRLENFAAREMRRYIFLRSGILAKIISGNSLPEKSESIIVLASKDDSLLLALAKKFDSTNTIEQLNPGEFYLKNQKVNGADLLLCAGGDSIAILYGAYQFAELLGIRFYIHGDVVPDKKEKFEIPKINRIFKPLFSIRGIQPFHDFPEGPDWWNGDDYKAIFAQLVKMKMNFIGLHTYPEGNVGPEPTVWIGLPEDIRENGDIRYSYSSRHFTTVGDMGWGYAPKKTSDYHFGADQLFERDVYGANYMIGRNPEPTTVTQSNALFNDMGKFLKDIFDYAKYFGIKTCIGTEIPLTIPKKLQEKLAALHWNSNSHETRRELYRGIFERIKRTHPLDYYWFWTPENWTWRDNSSEELEETRRDFLDALTAHEQVKPSFQLATCGWVLGPKDNRSMFDNFLPKHMPMSCINRNVGFEPLEPDFVKTSNRPKWAIPWVEDDPAIQIPQLWVGRLRRDAADALAYGCSGLIGIHWRTRILGPNLSALAKAAWDQIPWNKNFGEHSTYPEALEKSRSPFRDLPVSDFYQDWVTTQFGEEVSKPLVNLFKNLDGGELTPFRGKKITNLPRPADWYKGPGGLIADELSWNQRKKDYVFITEMESLREQVKGTGNLERFDYWLNNFKYLRAIGKFACSVGEMNGCIEKIQHANNPAVQKAIVENQAIPLRKRQMTELQDIHYFLLNTVTTPGGLGNIANWQQHIMYYYIDLPGEVLSYYFGEELPPDCWPNSNSLLSPRIFVPTIRTDLMSGEGFELKVIIPGKIVKQPYFFWKSFFQTDFEKIPLTHLNRAVYSIKIPAERIKEDFEYYIQADSEDGKRMLFPVTAPETNQTVVVF
jgi:hypothetical protein